MEFKNETNGACVVECGGYDAAFGRTFYSLTPSTKRSHYQNRPIASPSPGGEGRGEGELIFSRVHEALNNISAKF
jgi:hypothetical protein